MNIQGAARGAETADRGGGSFWLKTNGHAAEAKACGAQNQILRQRTTPVSQKCFVFRVRCSVAVGERLEFSRSHEVTPPGILGKAAARKNKTRSTNSPIKQNR